LNVAQSPAGLFAHYDLDRAFDEMFDAPGHARPQYQALLDELASVSLEDLRRRQIEADRAFLTQGITFTVYGDAEGTERIFPFDLLPRIVTAREWDTLERGLAQRLIAINLFLKDIYHDGRILAEGVVPRELVYSCRHYRREMRGVRVHRDVYVSVAGTDLVRLEDGRFVVLEDNLPETAACECNEPVLIEGALSQACCATEAKETVQAPAANCCSS